MDEPREYQQAIFETAKKHNTLVVLPTGLGKTLIALLLAYERLKAFPEYKILFLAPTRPLVEQHYYYFKKNLPEDYQMNIFTGKINPKKRAEIWADADIIFSTPQCIQFDLKNNRIDLETTTLLIEDEVHRCLKNYSYTEVAKVYLEQAQYPRILGLTASPSSDPRTIKQICSNLKIEAVEARTRQSPDVKPYIQQLTSKIIKIELPAEFQAARELLKIIYKKRIEELKNRKLLFSMATKTAIIKLQSNLHKKIATGNKHFNILRGVSVCAQAIKIQHAFELIGTQCIESSYNYMQDLYEQAEQKKSKASIQITNSSEFQDAYVLISKLFKENIEHPKIYKLKEIIKQEIRNKPDFKIIIFSQYRDTIRKINSELKKEGIKSEIFIGQSKRKLDGMTQKEQHLILHRFKEGKINCLISSSVGEEGIDIAEVGMVVFYEPIPSAIRKIQRTGRTARLKPGKLTVLMAKETRDESYYWAAHHKEKKMYETLGKLSEEFKNKKQKSISEFN